jgi:predicted nucleotidyltransferase component of viral defense system
MRYGEMRLLEKTHVVRSVLESYQHKNILEWELLEQDYALSWVLYGIAKTEPLSNHLIFKGGTCLRKYYFEKYRFSQDLEFSGEASCPSGSDLEALLNKAIHQTNLEVYRRNYNMKFYVERYKGLSSKSKDKGFQESFTVFVIYPWHREPCVKIKIEVSLFESLQLEKRQNSLIHLYVEELSGDLYTYSLEEMAATQILSFLCFNEIIEKQGWTSVKIKELHDLWFLVSLPNKFSR